MAEIKKCVICFEQIESNESMTELECDKRHFFHSKCIFKWIEVQGLNESKCPLCMKNVFANAVNLQDFFNVNLIIAEMRADNLLVADNVNIMNRVDNFIQRFALPATLFWLFWCVCVLDML